MQKFNPLYNPDGSFSRFRAACLLVIALCLAALGILRLYEAQHAESGDETLSAPDAVSDGDSSPLSAVFASPEQEAAKLRVKRRTAALAELADGAQFLSACGNINAGFMGCRFEFSPDTLEFYDAAVEAADDGFSITLKAKGEQAADLCVEYGIDSHGLIYAHDKQGREQLSCLPETLIQRDVSALKRSTDHAVPNPAPSGREPVITRTAREPVNASAAAGGENRNI